MQFSQRWMMKDGSALQSKSRSQKAKQVAGVISHDLWYFLCRTDKVGLRRVSLQTGSCIKDDPAREREREEKKERKKNRREGGREGGGTSDRRSKDTSGRDGQQQPETRPDVWRGAQMNYEFGWIWGKLRRQEGDFHE